MLSFKNLIVTLATLIIEFIKIKSSLTFKAMVIFNTL